MNRRTFLKSAAGAAVAGPAALGTSSAAAATTNPLAELKYRFLVPELFRALPDAPSYTPVVIIGSGFGGAVAAWRLAQAGVKSTVLERGSRWPAANAWRGIYSPDSGADGRAFWRQTTPFTGVTGDKVSTDYFGGVLDVTKFEGIDVWRAAAVGGGSVVYTGAHPIPEQGHFQHLFGGTVDYADMLTRWYPRAAGVLGSSTMPDDIYNSGPYSHSRMWDAMVKRAGFSSQLLPSVWDWNIMRREMSFGARQSATVSESNYGNSNGVKRGLTTNYLAYAEATGLSTIYSGHEVVEIGRDGSGRYLVRVQKVAVTGQVLSTRVISCDRLILSAGSIGTTELLMRARQRGTLPNLDDQIGKGWGGNGDSTTAWWFNPTGGVTQGAAPRSLIKTTVEGLPLTLENWFVPGFALDMGVIGSLAMTLDDTRADFGISPQGNLTLKWPGQPSTTAAVKAINAKIAATSRGAGGGALSTGSSEFFTAHPLGGAVLGKATDNYGRVNGHPGLYVMDGALLPGNAGAVNPAITITALAERNIAELIARGG
ncbi:MAG: GMC family oxidoreductase [Solirubrobacteraceae bacterium]|nr:GMC family oxidoreductase [Solirubrobacteraceae bacterium]